MNTNYFVYKLIPPRPTFAADMTEAEQAVMGEHAAYWNRLFAEGSVAVFGVVLEGAGAWGLAVVEAEDLESVLALGAEDPAVTSGVCTFDVGVMPSPSVRPRLVAA